MHEVGKPTNGTVNPPVKLAGHRTLWYNGDIKKNPPTRVRDHEMFKHISIILTSGTNELNDKQKGKNKKKKKSKIVYINNPEGPIEVPGLSFGDKEFRDFDAKNPF